MLRVGVCIGVMVVMVGIVVLRNAPMSCGAAQQWLTRADAARVRTATAVNAGPNYDHQLAASEYWSALSAKQGACR